MAEIELRPYQKKFIDDVRNEFKAGKKRVVGVAPCGAGKTIMTGWMIRESLNRGLRSIFFVHRKELLDQTAETFESLHIPFGIICSGFAPNYELPVQIASVQTLINRLDYLDKPDLLICDECHHILSDSYKKIINRWSDAFLLGVTATPIRLNEQPLSEIFDSMVVSVSPKTLIELGSLAKVKCYEIEPEFELKNINLVHGDYDKVEISKLLAKPDYCDKIVADFQRVAEGKKAIAYCIDVAHAKLLAETFQKSGISAIQCDGSTPKKRRQEIIEGFRIGKYQVLCNAELFGEGFDVPNCHAVILARPTKSLGLYIQQAMRAMRPDPADPQKVAMVLDFVGNIKQHDKPDQYRDWNLAFKLKKGEGIAPTKTCPRCKKTDVPASAMICGGDLPREDIKAIMDEAKATPTRDIINKSTSLRTISDLSSEQMAEYRWLNLLFDDIVKGRIYVPKDNNRRNNLIADIWGRIQIIKSGGCAHVFRVCAYCGGTLPFDTVVCPYCQTEVMVERLTGRLVETDEEHDATASPETSAIKRSWSFEEIFAYVTETCETRQYAPGWVYYQTIDHAKTYNDLLKIAHYLGYKDGWAYYKAKERGFIS